MGKQYVDERFKWKWPNHAGVVVAAEVVAALGEVEVVPWTATNVVSQVTLQEIAVAMEETVTEGMEVEEMVVEDHFHATSVGNRVTWPGTAVEEVVVDTGEVMVAADVAEVHHHEGDALHLTVDPGVEVQDINLLIPTQFYYFKFTVDIGKLKF